MVTVKEVTFDDLKNMEFHDIIIVPGSVNPESPHLEILRVPKGWIYTRLEDRFEPSSDHAPVFVPFSKKP